MSKAIATFDYDGLDKGKLNYYVGQFIKAMNHYSDSGMAVGKVIYEAHTEFAISGKEGRFSEWVETVLTCSRQTAYNYMWAYERFGSVKSVLQFDQAAMYKLASPNAPPGAVKEAIKLAEKGERIDGGVAKELLEKHAEKPKPKPAPKPAPAPFVDPVEAACDHDFDDEACRKCHAPKPAEQPAVKQYADTFDTATFSADAPFNLSAKQEPYDRMLNARTVIVKAWNEITSDERDGVYAVDKKNRVDQILRDLLAPIAQARPHAICDHCKGEGCKKCQNCGWWPRSVVEGLKR